MNLNKNVIIVTGSKGLLGRSIVENIEKNNGIAVKFDIMNNNNMSNNEFQIDLNDDNSIEKSLNKVFSTYGQVHGLVNNAYPRTKDWGNKFEDVSNYSFSKNIDMQLSRVFSISKLVLSHMKEKKSGSIVNIASIYGEVANDFKIYENTNIHPPVAYSAIKGGLISFNRYLASYFAKYQIRSNCVSPGGILDNQDPIFIKNYENKVPMGRMAKPDDIAPIVSFLLSNDSKYITGQNILVDGGWTII